MTSHWTGPGAKPGSEHRHAVAMQRLADGTWIPAPRAGARQARFQDSGFGGILVLVDGATGGRQLAKVNGVGALVLAEEN